MHLLQVERRNARLDRAFCHDKASGLSGASSVVAICDLSAEYTRVQELETASEIVGFPVVGTEGVRERDKKQEQRRITAPRARGTAV